MLVCFFHFYSLRLLIRSMCVIDRYVCAMWYRKLLTAKHIVAIGERPKYHSALQGRWWYSLLTPRFYFFALSFYKLQLVTNVREWWLEKTTPLHRHWLFSGKFKLRCVLLVFLGIKKRKLKRYGMDMWKVSSSL